MEGKAENNIKIGAGTSVRSVINYCLILLKKDFKDLHLTAMGGAIGSLILVAENVKILHPGLHQIYRISTINSQVIDNAGNVIQQKLFPKFEVTLTLNTPFEQTEGYQAPLSNEEREKLLAQLNATNDRQTERRDNTRGRGEFRGNRRGRGSPRGRGAPRGNTRGRGAPRGRGSRGNIRGRGAPRGNLRGRGFPGGRGFPRGRGAPREY